MRSFAFSRPAGLRTVSIESEMPCKMCTGFPHLCDLSDRHRCEFWRREVRKYVNARGADLDQLRIDCRVCGFISLLDEDVAHLVAQPLLESRDVVATQTVGRVENADFGVWVVLRAITY